MPKSRLLLLSLWMAVAFPLGAHPTPELKVEAEFSKDHSIKLHVNVDARLFLAVAFDPSTIPALPPSWWMDQSEEERAKTSAQARAYVVRTLSFFLGNTPLEPPWQVIPVDGNTLAPLNADSAEIHLLCDYQGQLPEVPGGFQVKLSTKSAVPIFLVNRREGDPDAYPQSIFQGESSSRFFPQPRSGNPSTAPASKTGEVREDLARPLWKLFTWSAGQMGRMDYGVLLIFAMVLLRGRFLTALGLLLAFHCGESAVVLAMQKGWFTGKPFWISISGWIFLALAIVATAIGLVWSRQYSILPLNGAGSPVSGKVVSSGQCWLVLLGSVFLGGTGACWGIQPESTTWLVWRQAAMLAWQAAFLALLFLGRAVLQKAREMPSLSSQDS